MIFQLLNGYTQQKSYCWRIAKLIGLLLLINVQLNIGQEIAEAKNSIDSQFREYTTVKNLNIGLTEYSQAEKVKSANFVCSAQLGAAIESVTNRPQFKRFSWGIVIQTLSSSRTLYSRDAQKYFIPASNVKLLTTAAALHQLGSQYRIRTSIYGTDNNDLLVVGRGDPSLTDTQLRQLAQHLSHRGIRQVRQIMAADNYFQGYAVNPSWEWEDVQADYGAPANSLIVNQNTVMLTLLPQQLNQKVRVVWANPIEATRWRIENEAVTVKPTESTSINVSRNLTGAILKLTGQISVDSQPESVSLAVVDPLDNFLLHLRWALLAEGIKETAALSGKTQISDIPKSATIELAAVKSPPLSQLLVETNQNSNNLYAEALLRTLGVNSNTSKSTASAESGLAVVKETLTRLGVDPAGYVLADGSGLTRHNLVSPEAIAQTLSVMAKSPLAPIYRASLSVAGINGTLQNRFRETAAQGILQGKTGTMSGVVALSGYLDSLNYEPLVFSIIVNESDQPAATIRQATDEIVLLLTRLHSC
ncbi:MAG: D-alanyl-D-alanine carboxypeptidase/D-alanyl-D-alanine-endopeptidase [Gloeocapsa sp. UFS-A4-WI-NPMV-4B04]|jgi:D-alanyl-D-alanine carboxypeptidase/D-alanyl-D-alanine-endopeptidase (penicillin-binding protein 4)|nr:D-alanyl-D-alanine carboxypeptidase/D-alanyl-D-alanine-endopeptidase [Gloeocapsa sp. UFS-A4-WI-NPMV-4B04]